MNPEVQEFIKKKNEEMELAQKARAAWEKDNLLDRFGLYKKEYSTKQFNYTNEDLAAYPYEEMVNGSLYRYRKIYPEITDEEYAELKKIASAAPVPAAPVKQKDSGTADYRCVLAKVMYVLAVITYCAFFIIGIVMGASSASELVGEYSEGFRFSIAFLYWVIGLFSGTMMLGFAHIVEHLYQQTGLLKIIAKK